MFRIVVPFSASKFSYPFQNICTKMSRSGFPWSKTGAQCLSSKLQGFFETDPGIERNKMASVPIGRSWAPNELRLKSFDELHKLWFVLLKELNLLYTQKLESRRFGTADITQSRISKCRLSMARLKSVLSERQILFRKSSSLLSENGALDDIASIIKRHKMHQELSCRYLRKRNRYIIGKQPLFS